MKNRESDYLEYHKKDEKIIRTETMFTPLLVFLPFFVGSLFLYHWFLKGFSMGISSFDGELLLGFIIIVGNIIFDIPFIRSIASVKK